MSNEILFYSTNDFERKNAGINFSQALLKGLAPDKGLFFMDRATLPKFTIEEIREFADLPYSEIAFRVIKNFTAGTISDSKLHELCESAYDFDVPVEEYAEGRYVMRLDRGPTASFKDFAAKMMGRLMQYYIAQENRSLTILTATSGDTGGAVSAAFYGLDNIKMVVLYPGSEVSERQRRQMTTLGKNVYAIDINGKFDDCQALVKQAFVDPDLFGYNLTSANSINVGRLIPQAVYYFWAQSRIKAEKDFIIVVPSGNFGNLMGGLLAKYMGLPVSKFVAATNENDEFPVFLDTTNYDAIVPSINCLSNAMNVGHPSNLTRLIALYGGNMDEKGNIKKMPDMDEMRNDIMSIAVTDKKTRSAIKDAYSRYDVIFEPHGAVGYYALVKLGFDNGDYTSVVLETAHPAKFPDVIIETIGVNPELPEAMKKQAKLPERKNNCENDYDDFKTLLKNILK